ncbi:hypothetical protein CDV36_002242 [Fusarium kuroshium]|uniref:L-arabinitol 4-dehydrogenase n=1 Tax=Fusarium kuroshium TaxID=2010991 RepID=A0A3M2SKJ6_9HYPO|nr:hypothetical protein CDV36_002242 [Fusarium kuroshium]
MKFAADPPLTQGTLSRFFRIPEDFAYKIPDSVDLQEAVLVEPLAVAVHGVRLAGLEVGQRVLVQGSGTVGLLTAAAAKAYGAKQVYITDINPEKLEFAKKYLGCSTFAPDLDSTPEENADRFKKEMGLDDGIQVVLECTGVEASAQTGLHALSSGGVFVQIGLGKPVQAIPIHAMSEKEIVLKTSFRYGPGDYEIALELLESGKVSVAPLISSIVPFEKAADAWEKTRKGEGIKNLIQGVQE